MSANFPALEGVSNTFEQERNLGGLPFSQEVVVGRRPLIEEIIQL